MNDKYVVTSILIITKIDTEGKNSDNFVIKCKTFCVDYIQNECENHDNFVLKYKIFFV